MNPDLPDQLDEIHMAIADLQFVRLHHELTPNEREALADALTALYEIRHRLRSTMREARA